MVDVFKQDAVKFLKDDYLDAKKMMSLYDQAFRICCGCGEYGEYKKGERLYCAVLEILMDMAQNSQTIIEIAEGRRRYLIDHRIVAIKEINAKIADMVFGHVALREEFNFKVKAQSLHRITAYLERFWILHAHNVATKVKVRGIKFAVQPVYDAAMTIWSMYNTI